jgi:gliding motility-associated-like protein
MVDQIERFQVFDRWGERLYEAAEFAINDLSVGWDGSFRGKAMPAGVYAWVVEVSFVDGRKEVYKGNTTLVR